MIPRGAFQPPLFCDSVILEMQATKAWVRQAHTAKKISCYHHTITQDTKEYNRSQILQFVCNNTKQHQINATIKLKAFSQQGLVFPDTPESLLCLCRA